MGARSSSVAKGTSKSGKFYGAEHVPCLTCTAFLVFVGYNSHFASCRMNFINLYLYIYNILLHLLRDTDSKRNYDACVPSTNFGE